MIEKQEEPGLGMVFMSLMLCPPNARCEKCNDARARQRKPDPNRPYERRFHIHPESRVTPPLFKPGEEVIESDPYDLA